MLGHLARATRICSWKIQSRFVTIVAGLTSVTHSHTDVRTDHSFSHVAYGIAPVWDSQYTRVGSILCKQNFVKEKKANGCATFILASIYLVSIVSTLLCFYVSSLFCNNQRQKKISDTVWLEFMSENLTTKAKIGQNVPVIRGLAPMGICYFLKSATDVVRAGFKILMLQWWMRKTVFVMNGSHDATQREIGRSP